jgi:hypothetical protein
VAPHYVKTVLTTDGNFDLAISEQVLAATQLSDTSWVLIVLGTGSITVSKPIVTLPSITLPTPFVPAQPDPKKP